ncbi:MAG: SRPBCC domain-containing protein [Deltaproteobacteria bacterium]|nr:SRPBCC domain-containing protein [Deltaproteobacteria bacterium]MBI3294041.1 SRPBCC domain-containing protein [Deltaproteobacteria bacterium]
MSLPNIDPKLDLVFERATELSGVQMWDAWTNPLTLPKWFCPRPWWVTACRIDLRAGGEFFTVMEGPGEERMENHGCYLEVVMGRRLVWTNMMSAGFRPRVDQGMGFPFVARITFAPEDGKTIYRAVVSHADEAGGKQHEAMGFQEGWGLALQQLEELVG